MQGLHGDQRSNVSILKGQLEKYWSRLPRSHHLINAFPLRVLFYVRDFAAGRVCTTLLWAGTYHTVLHVGMYHTVLRAGMYHTVLHAGMYHTVFEGIIAISASLCSCLMGSLVGIRSVSRTGLSAA